MVKLRLKCKYKWILYLKFKLSNGKTVFAPRDNEIFSGISLNLVIFQVSAEFRG